MRGDAAFGFRAGERKHGITGTAKFEGPDFLKILALKKQLGIGHVIQAGAGQHGRMVGVRLDAGGSLANIVDRWQ